MTGAFTTGRLATASVGGDAVYIVRHEDLACARIVGERVESWLPARPKRHERPLQDDRYVHAAADETGTIWFLDDDGAVYRRGPADRALVPVAPSEPRVAGHYAHRVGFVWDRASDRLVVVGGDSRRNDTHVLARGAHSFRSLATPGPRHGRGRAVATSVGVYLLVERELWLLGGDDWHLAGRLPEVGKYRRPLLLADDECLLVIGNEGWLVVDGAGARSIPPAAELPERLLDDHAGVVAIDPTSRRLVICDQDGVRTRPLERKRGVGWPVDSLPRPERVADPPLHWYREAAALDADPAGAEVTEPDVPDDKIVLAILPAGPFLPLGEAQSLVLLAHDPPYERDWARLDYDNAFEVRLVEEVLRPCLPVGRRGLRPLVAGPRFREVDPAYAEQVETLRGGEPWRAGRSKLGGFPALLQGGREEAADGVVAELRCERCYTHLRFAAQLTPPHFVAMSGVLYLYLCPFGCCGAAYVQN